MTADQALQAFRHLPPVEQVIGLGLIVAPVAIVAIIVFGGAICVYECLFGWTSAELLGPVGMDRIGDWPRNSAHHA